MIDIFFCNDVDVMTSESELLLNRDVSRVEPRGN